ncbi:MAG: helix-turn-helix domain-containing protein [Anaerovoracaceae bacterium]
MTENNLKTIDLEGMGRRIRTKRESMHMSRPVLANQLNVSSKFVADIEYGDKGVSIQTLYKLSQLLHLSTDYILAGERKQANGEDPEIDQIKENILGPLSTCNTEQLKCMEQITRYYVEGIIGKGK